MIIKIKHITNTITNNGEYNLYYMSLYNFHESILVFVKNKRFNSIKVIILTDSKELQKYVMKYARKILHTMNDIKVYENDEKIIILE